MLTCSCRMQVRHVKFLYGMGTHGKTAELQVLNTCPRAHGAGYQHGDQQGCLSGTREAILDKIETWTKDFYESPVYWLNGLAGTGKSTIAQTTAECLFANGQLGASFFCSCDSKDRSNLHLIFPTLSFQLAHRYPDFRSILVPLLQSNPDIGYESLHSQMDRLIVTPLKEADILTVVVIDTLDECTDEEPQSAILSVMGCFVEEIPNIKFFITGQPEPCHAPDIFHFSFPLSLFISSLKTIQSGHLCVIGAHDGLQRLQDTRLLDYSTLLLSQSSTSFLSSPIRSSSSTNHSTYPASRRMESLNSNIRSRW